MIRVFTCCGFTAAAAFAVCLAANAAGSWPGHIEVLVQEASGGAWALAAAGFGLREWRRSR